MFKCFLSQKKVSKQLEEKTYSLVGITMHLIIFQKYLKIYNSKLVLLVSLTSNAISESFFISIRQVRFIGYNSVILLGLGQLTRAIKVIALGAPSGGWGPGILLCLTSDTCPPI